jgi:trehalose 6-phosphate phosphatase
MLFSMNETGGAGTMPHPGGTPLLAGSTVGEPLSPDLRQAITRLARTPRLLVGCDYDGTLSSGPATGAAISFTDAVAVLRSIAELPQTEAAVISGRPLRDLAVLSRLPSEIRLVGSHGSEFDPEFIRGLGADASVLRMRLTAELSQLADACAGASVEAKPAGVLLHLHEAATADAESVAEEIRRGPATWPGVEALYSRTGIELSVVPIDKGHALDELRRDFAADAVFFTGDEVTDEKAFSRLSGNDVSIKLGPGETAAAHRVSSTAEVVAALTLLFEERHSWLHGNRVPRIERLSMLADGRSVALLTPDARVTWFCHPRPDSPAVFADLLGGPDAGHFTVAPRRPALPLGQRYLPGTMTVETRWPGLMVTDYLQTQTPARRTVLLRVVSGTAAADIEFAPRPEFGQVPIRLVAEDGGLRVIGAGDPMRLSAPGVDWEITSDGQHDTARARVQPSPGNALVLEFLCGPENRTEPRLSEPERREQSGAYWANWLHKLSLPPLNTALVARSALTLRGLCHTELGGILAAATTSLPEDFGGIRNWDYRYCWIRDGAMTAQTLVSLGSFGEAEAFLSWLHRVLETVDGPELLNPLYTLAGERLSAESTIANLAGYAGSRPVRVGNLADEQLQLDVFGPVAELVAELAHRRGHLSAEDWSLTRSMVEAVARRWFEPDHGIWEERSRPRHHVYSKVMCWVAVDRALTIAAEFDRYTDPTWSALRDRIAEEVLRDGWNPAARSYTTAYDGEDLDAASLHIGLSGLLDVRDQRFVDTVAAVEAELRHGPTVYRYRRHDGLTGDEGGLHICTSWLIEAYHRVGRFDDARELFKHLIDAAGPTGLLPEEYDPVAERSLGNHPQAYSHLGLIRCAQLLSD